MSKNVVARFTVPDTLPKTLYYSKYSGFMRHTEIQKTKGLADVLLVDENQTVEDIISIMREKIAQEMQANPQRPHRRGFHSDQIIIELEELLA